MESVIIASSLAALAIVMALFYGKRTRQVRKEYLEAKSAIDDIVLSFSRQLHSQDERLGIAAQKIHVLSSGEEIMAEKLEEQKGEIEELAEKVKSLPKEDVTANIHTMENKLSEFMSLKETLEQRITEIEKTRLTSKESEKRIESAIPIRREKALAPLTETELLVLEFLATEKEKTAPEIKDKVKLSREHTARLMKKLYERGYLERSSNKIPFVYRLKEEMQRLLKNPEPKG